MNLLFRVLYAAHCKSTHHKLALDALRFLSCPNVEDWRRLFLKQHVPYLQGAKEPDTKFRDFQNHVVHVEQNNWGGAAKAAELWYGRAVQQLRRGDWVNGVYAAGILSHYYTDPIQPFHTGQSQAEQNIHRAAEWSITKSYADIWAIAEKENYFADVEVPSGSNWLTEMVHAGAATSHPYYDELIKHYDFAAGSKNPPKGLDDHSRRVLAKLIAYAVVGFSRVLARLIRDANVAAPQVSLSIETVVASLNVPIAYVTKQLADRNERVAVKAMFDEYQRTGKVVESLDDDEKAIRRMVAERDGTAPTPQPVKAAPKKLEDVPQRAVMAPAVEPRVFEPAPARAEVRPSLASEVAQTAEPKPAVAEPSVESNDAAEVRTQRRYLTLEADIVDAPSIGPKMAERFYAVGLNRVSDLLSSDPERACEALAIKQLTPELFKIWQSQAQLCCDIPGLRGHDAQILVACGYRTADAVANADHAELTKAAIGIVSSPAGQRVLRGSNPPDAEEVAFWIQSARGEQTRAAA